MNDDQLRKRLQERFLRTILEFPGRLEAMETRDEEGCRRLADRLAELAARELGGRASGPGREA